MSTADLELRVLDRLGSFAPAWDALAAAQPVPSPFLRSWWLEHAVGAELVLLCWFDGGELIGGAAFERDRAGRSKLSIERLRSVGHGVLAPDHLDLIATDEHRVAVTAATATWLGRKGSRVVDLDGLLAEGSLARILRGQVAGVGDLRGEVLAEVGAPYAPLPQRSEDYLAARPGRVRSTITRTAKRFEREGLTHRSVDPDDPGEIESALDRLADLHEGRWAEESVFLKAWTRFRSAALAGFAAGELTLDELVTADRRVVATELDLVVADRTYFYQAGRDTSREFRGGGSVLRSAIIRRAIERGHREYDLLRGDEGYKSDWASERRVLIRCRVGVGPGGRAAIAALSLRDHARALRRRAASARDRRPRSEQNG